MEAGDAWCIVCSSAILSAHSAMTVKCCADCSLRCHSLACTYTVSDTRQSTGSAGESGAAVQDEAARECEQGEQGRCSASERLASC